MTNEKNEKILNKVLSHIQSMGGITAKAQYDGVGLFKEEKLFGIINNGSLYFRSENVSGTYFSYKGNKLPFILFNGIDKILLPNLPDKDVLADEILKNATHGYWIESRKKRISEIFTLELEEV